MKKRSLTSVFFILLLSILLISTFKIEVYAQSTPKVAIVSLEHVPFAEGDNNEFYISAKNYTGQVQYQLFYIQESVMKEWKLINNEDMVNGWTNYIDAQTPIIVDISKLNLKADKYRFAIRVRRVGVKGLKQNSYGDYDDAYPFNLDVVGNSNITLNGSINIEKTNFTTSENLVINGVGDLLGDIQYKLHLFDVKNSKWLTNLTEYNTNVNYSLKSIPGGTYIVDLWARNTKSNTKYDGWKLKVIDIKEVPTISLNKTTSILAVGGVDKLTTIVRPIDAKNNSVTWISSNDEIAKVDATGKVTALKVGTATITAITIDKALKVTCEVVSVIPEYVENINYTLDSNEGTYTGFIVNNIPNGQGSFYSKEGNGGFVDLEGFKFTMVGIWTNGYINGQGTITWKNGNKYVGQFNNGSAEGQGTMTHANGDKYVGQFKNGNFDGKGTITWIDGNKYIGEFKNDLRNGQGTLTWADGTKYVGQFKDNKREGQGTMTWTNGTKYIGQFKNNKPDGKGTMTWANGTKYVGEFKDGKMVSN